MMENTGADPPDFPPDSPPDDRSAPATLADKSPARLALISMIWLLGFSLIARGAGFLKEMALAHRFGVGPVTDAYVLGFTWATWIPSIFASVAMATVVPTVAHLTRESPAECDLFSREFAGATLAIGLAVAAAIALYPAAYGRLTGLESSLATSLPALALMVPALFVGAYGSTRLVAVHRHGNLALEAVPALLLAFVLVVPWPLDLLSLSLATSASYVAFAASVLILMKRNGLPMRMRLGFRSRGWTALASAATALVVGNLCAGSLTVVDQLQAASLGEGSVSTLGREPAR